MRAGAPALPSPMLHQLPPAEKDLGGGFRIQRLLPSIARRSVGPFVFFDHFGPVTVRPEDNHDVRPHPHIGLATVTWLFDGAMMHRDSLGVVQRIEPGAINFMTAGRGIVHSERRPPDLASRAFTNHGLQLWLALPTANEEDEPSFQHVPAASVPSVAIGQIHAKVLLGEVSGVRSAVVTPIPALYLDLAIPAGEHHLPALAPEAALFGVTGDVWIDGEQLRPLHLAVLDGAVTIRGPGRVVLVGGEPLDGPRTLSWNFVSSRPERLRLAGEDWVAGRFPTVPGETEFIPLPGR